MSLYKPSVSQQGLNTYLSNGLQCAPQPAADWLRGCHGYKKVPPSIKTNGGGEGGIKKKKKKGCLCVSKRGVSCQGDTLANTERGACSFWSWF